MIKYCPSCQKLVTYKTVRDINFSIVTVTDTCNFCNTTISIDSRKATDNDYLNSSDNQ